MLLRQRPRGSCFPGALLRGTAFMMGPQDACLGQLACSWGPSFLPRAAPLPLHLGSPLGHQQPHPPSSSGDFRVTHLLCPSLVFSLASAPGSIALPGCPGQSAPSWLSDPALFHLLPPSARGRPVFLKRVPGHGSPGQHCLQTQDGILGCRPQDDLTPNLSPPLILTPFRGWQLVVPLSPSLNTHSSVPNVKGSGVGR